MAASLTAPTSPIVVIPNRKISSTTEALFIFYIIEKGVLACRFLGLDDKIYSWFSNTQTTFAQKDTE